MGDGNDKDPVGLDAVEEPVGKAGHQGATETRAERMAALRKGGQPLVGELY